MISSGKNSENTLAVAVLAAAVLRENPGIALSDAVSAARGALNVGGQRISDADILASVRDDKIKCFEDGTWHTMLRRYIARRYNLTPAQYKEKWGLPDDYPFVAPNYARQRSSIAKNSGLGKNKGNGK